MSRKAKLRSRERKVRALKLAEAAREFPQTLSGMVLAAERLASRDPKAAGTLAAIGAWAAW